MFSLLDYKQLSYVISAHLNQMEETFFFMFHFKTQQHSFSDETVKIKQHLHLGGITIMCSLPSSPPISLCMLSSRPAGIDSLPPPLQPDSDTTGMSAN